MSERERTHSTAPLVEQARSGVWWCFPLYGICVGVFSNRSGFSEFLAFILLMRYLKIGDDDLVMRLFFLLG